MNPHHIPKCYIAHNGVSTVHDFLLQWVFLGFMRKVRQKKLLPILPSTKSELPNQSEKSHRRICKCLGWWVFYLVRARFSSPSPFKSSAPSISPMVRYIHRSNSLPICGRWFYLKEQIGILIYFHLSCHVNEGKRNSRMRIN